MHDLVGDLARGESGMLPTRQKRGQDNTNTAKAMTKELGADAKDQIRALVDTLRAQKELLSRA